MRSIASKTVTASQVRREIAKPLCRFRLYPENPRGHFFWVDLYAEAEGVEAAHQMHFPESADHEVWAFVDIKSARGRCMGTMAFSKPGATDRIVAHECLHAALRWAYLSSCGEIPGDRMDMEHCTEWQHPHHERLAMALEQLVSGFWRNFTKRGFPRKECWGFLPPATS